MKKLLIFDSWTKGAPHIVRLLDELKSEGVGVLLVHMGSWGDEPGRPTRERIGTMDVHDIRCYRGLNSVLSDENPDAVLFLSLDPMLHRAFNRYCRKQDVPTINLYPGLWSAQAYDDLGTSRGDFIGHLRWAGSRLKRFLRYVFPVYIASLVRTGASPSDWRAFFSEVYQKLLGIGTVVAPADAEAHHVCVYNGYDVEHAQQKYNLSLDRITKVGIPDLIKFPSLEDSICVYAGEQSETHGHVVYIGTGIRGTGMKILDPRDYVQHLLKTRERLSVLGKTLVCKLHYSRMNAVEEALADAGIMFCDDDGFVRTLTNSCGAIVEPSSAAMVPLVMGKPIFLARYGKLEGLSFGSMLSSYPRATSIDSFDDLSLVGESKLAASIAETDAWIREVAGPLPASEMPRRVVNVICSAMNVAAAKK